MKTIPAITLLQIISLITVLVYAEADQVYKKNRLGFTITIPDKWIEQDEMQIEGYNSILGGGGKTFFYDGIWGLELTEDYPYIITANQIRKKVNKNSLRSIFNLDDLLLKNSDSNMMGKNRGIIELISKYKSIFDEKRYLIWSIAKVFDKTLEVVVFNLSGIFLTETGFRIFVCKFKEKNFAEFGSLCEKIITSVKIHNEIKYHPETKILQDSVAE